MVGYVYGVRCANNLHMVQLMPLLPHNLCFGKISEWFIFLVLAYTCCSGKKVVKRVLLVKFYADNNMQAIE